MKGKILCFLVLLILIFAGCESEFSLNNKPKTLEKKLEHYPYFFFDENNAFDAVIIIDDNAPEEDITTAHEYMVYLKNYDSKINEEIIVNYPSQYKDLTKKNAILIGSCSQQPQNKFANVYTDCLSMMKEQAIIRIIKHNNVWLLYVIGYDPNKTKQAVDVLKNFKNYDSFKGQDIEVVMVDGKYRLGEPR